MTATKNLLSFTVVLCMFSMSLANAHAAAPNFQTEDASRTSNTFRKSVNFALNRYKNDLKKVRVKPENKVDADAINAELEWIDGQLKRFRGNQVFLIADGVIKAELINTDPAIPKCKILNGNGFLTLPPCVKGVGQNWKTMSQCPAFSLTNIANKDFTLNFTLRQKDIDKKNVGTASCIHISGMALGNKISGTFSWSGQGGKVGYAGPLLTAKAVYEKFTPVQNNKIFTLQIKRRGPKYMFSIDNVVQYNFVAVADNVKIDKVSISNARGTVDVFDASYSID